MRFFVIVFSIITLLAGCTSSRYEMKHDAAPLRHPNPNELQDPQVIPVKKSVSASAPYTVRGKTYYPMHSEQGFSEQGIASWYGRKFHGYHTSNGEVYDMFAMTAAHKTLPLPSFVKVTNLENGKSAVVRVNDRGPFHDDRIIDLSYAAAYKLGFYRQGTANVKIEALLPNDSQAHSAYIQIVAASNPDKLGALGRALELEHKVPSKIIEKDGIYRLRLGPIANGDAAKALLNRIKQTGHQKAFMLYSDS